MNETIFFAHILLVIGLVLIGSKWGKHALIALVVLQAVLANLFVVKQMSLFGFSVTCSDVFAVGGILGLNLLQEHYGRTEANLAVKASFLGLVFFMIMSLMHLWYTPLSTDITQDAFEKILSSNLRITCASIGVYYLVQKLDVRLFDWLKNLFQGKRLPLRIAVSLLLTQLLDTILFSFLGLYGLIDSILDVILVSFFVKCLIIFSSSFLIAFTKRFVKHVPI